MIIAPPAPGEPLQWRGEGWRYIIGNVLPDPDAEPETMLPKTSRAALILHLSHVASVPAYAQGSPAGPLRLKLLSVSDPMVNNLEAFRMLVPVGWQAQGGIVWRQELANLAYAAMRVSNPSGPERLEMFPIVSFTWQQGGIYGFPPGSLYLGMYVQPPVSDVASFVQQFVIPQFRQGARVVGRQELPEVAREVAAGIQEPGITKRVIAERVRLVYQEGGRPLDEDVYGVLVYSQTAMMPGFVLWGPERLYSFRADQGKLDANGPLLQSMIASVRLDPTWFAQYRQVVSMWQQNQMQAIRNAGELSRYLSRTNDEITRMYREAWEQRQAAQDRAAQSFSQYIRGVETFQDPVAGHDVQLPSGYSDYWVSGNGEYVLSHDANFNPNVGGTQNWQRLEPARP